VKIVSQDQDHLVAHEDALLSYIFGAIFAAAGLVVGAVILVSAHQISGALFAVIPLIIGVLLIVAAKARTLTIDKSAGQMTLNVKSIFGSKDYPYATADVTKIQLITSFQQEYVGGGGRGSVGHEETEEKTSLLLVLKDGTTIDLADAQRGVSSFGVFGKVPNQGIGQQIATFLGVPFETAGPTSLGQVVQGVESMIKGGGAPSFMPGQSSVPPAAPTPPATSSPQPPPPPSQPTQPAPDSDKQ
jgi:hypothetical protein